MAFDRTLEAGIDLATIVGRFDTEAAESVETDFDALVSGSGNHTVVDMTGVDYISSSMIRILLKAFKQHKAADKGFHLAGIQPKILKVLEMAGLAPLFSIHNTREDALTALK